jgi:hypothetical protein
LYRVKEFITLALINNSFSVKRIVSFVCLALGVVFAACAAPVDLPLAKQVAYQAALCSPVNAVHVADRSVSRGFTYSTARGPVLHVVELADGTCVIVPATDALPPVLGMFERPATASALPAPMRWLLQGYAAYADAARTRVATPAVARQWAMLKAGATDAQNASLTCAPLPPVVPALLTTTWDQTCNYNANCPADGAGFCGRTLTGCGATALAQMLKFHAYPDSGYGSHTYTPSGYPSQTANYGSTRYNWPLMPNSLSGANAEVARVMHHCGVAVEMIYSTSSSNSYFSDADNALRAYFRYSLSTRGHSKILYTDPAWDGLLRGELDLGRPMLFNGGTHIWVLDGYQILPTSLYHMNWGWGGTYNGWFALTNLNPGSLTFSNTGVVAGIKPAGAFECQGDSLRFPVSGFAYNFEVVSDSAWTASSSVGWAVPSITAGGKGYFNIAVTASANPLYTPRYGHVAVRRGAMRDTVWLRQDPRVGYVSAAPSPISEGFGGGSHAISVSCDSNWVVFSASPWISYAPGAGIGNGSITLTVAANAGLARTGFMELRRGSKRDSVIVNQDPVGATWCIPGVGVPTAVGVTQVHLKSIHRSSGVSEGYLLAPDSTKLFRDSTYTIYLTFSGSVAPAIWLDFNQDGDFFDAGETIIAPGGTWYPTFGGNKFTAFTVPSAATTGKTRLRVLVKAFPGPASGPCSGTGIGDVEDFDVWLMPNTPLASNAVVLSASSGSAPWLRWQLATPSAVTRYEVLRQEDGGLAVATELPGTVLSWQPPTSGDYCVRAAFANGQQLQSQVLHVERADEFSFDVSPNPATVNSDVTLRLRGATQAAKVYVHDMQGRQFAIVEGLNATMIRISTAGFPAGSYLLTAVVDGHRHSQRLVIR